MHKTRRSSSKLLPITRKGTKYVIRARGDSQKSLPLLIAIRDILKLAKTSKEFNQMIKDKILKVNGKTMMDNKASMNLFSILEAGKSYKLSLTPTKKFTLIETKDKERLCKVMSKKLLSGNKIQLNLNDGSNVMSKDKINVGDSVYLSFDGKIKSHIPLEKGKTALILAGKYQGLEAKVDSFKDGKVEVSINGKKTTLPHQEVIVQ